MQGSSIHKKRSVIPRWRSFIKTFAEHDLLIPRKDKISFRDDAYLHEKLSEWSRNRSIDLACEIIYFSIVTSDHEISLEQAAFVRDYRGELPPHIRHMAQEILKFTNVGSDISQNNLNNIFDHVHKEIRSVRNKLSEWNRNPILWVDLSRLYTIIDQDRKADKAMRIALSLASKNRFVLRSASRMAIHQHDPEKALHIIRKNDGYYRDPWLLATEIAVSSLINKRSRKDKYALTIIRENKLGSSNISELASAMGTAALNDGSMREAKKFFNTSLIAPNDNVLAQAVWASTAVSGLPVKAQINIPNAYEARAREALETGEWELALNMCVKWLLDEPYSSMPAEFGSYIAIEFLDDFKRGEELCNIGLLSNPNDVVLKNNLAFICAQTNQIDKAVNILDTIHDVAPEDNIALLATRGAIKYKQGKSDDGKTYYLQAIEKADEAKNPVLKARAALHLYEEEIKLSGKLPKDIEEMMNKLIKNLNNRELNAIYKKIQKNIKIWLKKAI